MSPELIREFGLPVGLVIVVTYFFIRVFWPWIIKQIEITQQQAKDAYEMVAGLKQTLAVHTELSRQMVDMLKDIKENLDDRDRK